MKYFPKKGVRKVTKKTKRRVSAYQKATKKLLKRISKEFDKKFFIGDIIISDYEYDILIDRTASLLRAMTISGRPTLDSPVLAVAMVQIGIRRYDGKFWSHAERVLGYEMSQKNRNLLGDTLISTLKAHKKFILSESERVQTTLFHGFVSNYYSKGLFELLFQYYSKDLERDIYRNDTQQMQALMDTLAKKASMEEGEGEAFADQFMVKGSRSYKLRHHTLNAISANPVHSRVRLRRLLRLIDDAFWNGKIPKNPSSRLTILFKEWIEESPSYRDEYAKYMLGEIRNKGKKHFATPYLYADIRRTSFELRLPAQIIRESIPADAYWEVTTNKRTRTIPVEYGMALTGFKTLDHYCSLTSEELFGTIKCQLLWGDIVIKRFGNIPAADVRFFDLEGDYAARLFKIPMCAYTRKENRLASSALLKNVQLADLVRWDFVFERGDVVILPSGESMVVGDHYADGLVPRGRVPGVSFSDAKHIGTVVYANIPDMIVTVPITKLQETAITVNHTRFDLKDIEYTKFDVSGKKDECAILISLAKTQACIDRAINSVFVSVPGNVRTQSFDFVLIKGFSAQFDGAPYVFEERGTVVFPEHVPVTCEDAEALHGENGFCFDLTSGIDRLMITVDDDLYLDLQIPVFSWSLDGEYWRIEPAGELWHTEFNKIKKLYVRSPISKIIFSTDSDVEDDEDDQYAVRAEQVDDEKYIVDMRMFKKWMSRDVMKHDINLRLGNSEYRFASVYTRSFVLGCDINADHDANELSCVCDIIGMSEYYIDIKHKLSGHVIADKEPLVDGKFSVKDPLRSGVYIVEVFESDEDEEDDESAFWPIHTMEKELINKNDISGKHLSIRKFKPSRMSNLYTNFAHQYWIKDLSRVDSYTYHGKLWDNGIEAKMDVEIRFGNIDDMRFFTVAFWDDYEEMYLDFLFDAKMGKLVQEEVDGLRPSERYRRYRVLFEDDYIFFGILEDRFPYEK